MFGRIFGRGKDEPETAVCAMCGRTLLAGEWTRRVTDPNGDDRLVCSLCGPDLPLDDRDLVDAGPEPAADLAVQEMTPAPEPAVEQAPTSAPSVAASAAPSPASQDVSPFTVFEDRLAAVEARCGALEAEAERLSEAVQAGALGGPSDETEGELLPEGAPIDSSEPGERTWGETPAEFAALLQASVTENADAATGMSAASVEEEPEPVDTAVDAGSVEELQNEDSVAEPDVEEPVTEDAGASADELESAPDQEASTDDTLVPTVEAAGAPAGEHEVAAIEASTDEVDSAEEPDEVTAAGTAFAEEQTDGAAASGRDTEAEVAALALLQRGVDLFNVSRVPRRIAETNEQLGTPDVRAEALDDGIVSVVFMWSMGWYRFHVDTESGAVDMAERGYEEAKDVASNAGVRADGTIHLAPAQISTAAAHRAQQDDGPGARSADRGPGEPESPSVAAQKAPEILSKSLLGQRSDDEPADWEKTRARDFDWER